MYMMGRVANLTLFAIPVIYKMGKNDKANRKDQKQILLLRKELLQYKKYKPGRKQ